MQLYQLQAQAPKQKAHVVRVHMGLISDVLKTAYKKFKNTRKQAKVNNNINLYIWN